MAGHPQTIWPEITSPVAHELIELLFNLPYSRTDKGDAETYMEGLPPHLLQYQQWVRPRLRRSQLAQRIAAGTDWLPDFEQELPQPFGTLFRMLRPRTLPQMARHMVVFLEWYVDPARAAPLAIRAVLITAVLLILLAAFLVPAAIFGALPPSLMLWAAALIAASPAASFWLSTAGVSNFAKRTVNATELYWYLRQAYSDAPADSNAQSSPPPQASGR